MMGPMGDALIKAYKDGKIKPMTKADVAALDARPKLTDEQVAQSERRWRDSLAKCDPHEFDI